MIWLKRILIALVIVAALIGGGGFLLPSTAHVERSVVIHVPQAQLFTVVNSFDRFNEWSPWAELDPQTRYTFGGPSTGVGANMSWASADPAVGAGSQEIIESSPPSLVRVKLVFEGQGDAIAFYRLEPLEDGTKITWGFDSDFGNDVIGRWFGYLLFDSMLGADYDKGLSKLKMVLEQPPVDAAPTAPVDTAPVDSAPTADPMPSDTPAAPQAAS